MKILVAGDYCPQDRVASAFEIADYDMVLGGVRDLISQVDYSVVNLECPVTTDNAIPISKCGPNLHCPHQGIEAIKWAGFNCVTLANNHFRDYGDIGCCNTFKELSQAGIDYLGGGTNLQEASRVHYVHIENQAIAIINCCEHEFSIATDTRAGSYPLNPIQQYYSICEARKKADYVLVIVHGGHEYYQLPSPRMQDTYRFFIDAGADVVLNHHQHCYSGYELYHGKPIFYGLGNLCFDKAKMRDSIWNEGYMVMLRFHASQIAFQLFPYVQCNDNPSIEFLTDDTLFCSKIKELNLIISNRTDLSAHFERWCRSKLPQKEMLFSRYYGSFLNTLHLKGLLPSFNSSQRLLALNDHIECESHRDTTLFYFHSVL